MFDLTAAIVKARAGRGFSQTALAEMVGADRSAIARLESGIGSVALLTRVMSTLDMRLINIARGAALHDQLRAARQRQGLTMEQAALKSGMTAKTLSAIEAGRGTLASLIKVQRTLARRAKVAEPLRASWAYDRSGDRDQRYTPRWYLAAVEQAFGPISLDPCHHPLSAVRAERTIQLPACGLEAKWSGRLAYINPPYSNLTQWVARAVDAFETGEVAKVVLLIPTRTDSSIFHNRLLPIADIGFLKGRMKFDLANGGAYASPFAVMSVVMGATDDEIAFFDELAPAAWMRRG